TNNRLISVVSINVQSSPSKELGEDVSRCSHTLSCGSPNRYSESTVHGWSPCKKRENGLVALEAAASGIPGRDWTRFIDCEAPAFEVLAVHFGNSLITAVLHFDETKTFGAAGVAIGNDADRFNRARLAEQFLEITLRRLKRQISDIQLLFHGISPFI